MRPARADQANGYVDFVTAHGPGLQRLARALVRSDADAADLVQDVLAAALVHWARVAAADDPAAYVRRMVVNAATSWWRRPARREAPTTTGRLPGPRTGQAPAAGWPADGHVPDHGETHAVREELLAALRALPRRQRAVLVLRHYEGLDDTEIAKVMGITASTVRSNAARATTTLRTHLGHLGQDTHPRTGART